MKDTAAGSSRRGVVYEDPRAGRRPFLIVTRDEAMAVLHQVVAVPATRTVRGIPTEVALDEDVPPPRRRARGS